MSVDELSPRLQDAVKCIWGLAAKHVSTEEETLVQPGQLASAMQQKSSATSEIIRRLVDADLATARPYEGVALTKMGEEAAITMIRRHRLIEMFLAETLGYGWEDVHKEAEILEHAVSDTFIERLDVFLGHPRRDPHGHPIPTMNGSVPMISGRTLADVQPGQRVVIDQISDRDPQLLKYLAETGLVPGKSVQVMPPPYPEVVVVAAEHKEPAVLALNSAGLVFIADEES